SDESGKPMNSGFRMDSLKEPVVAITRNPIQRCRYLLATSALPAFETMSHRLLRSTVYRDHARLALALESHRIAHGSYPPSLQELNNSGNDLNLTDPVTGAPYLYRLLD